ncbi:hypothetical protein MVEN_00153600 [Mycena venus]|uniref:Uncharacterized protein n=1 Tax=Mycena venus TaxID=2733690 RepID=A0A8H7DDP4_9AGAR|nr:hypothetical protein MVEN_00153600 [Mycena venus]
MSSSSLVDSDDSEAPIFAPSILDICPEPFIWVSKTITTTIESTPDAAEAFAVEMRMMNHGERLSRLAGDLAILRQGGRYQVIASRKAVCPPMERGAVWTRRGSA